MKHIPQGNRCGQGNRKCRKYNESKTTKISREEEKYSSQALEQNVDKTTTQENEKDKKKK